MPLKHITETVLVILLGVVLIVTGVLINSLPSIPAGLLPWAIVFVLTLTYPLALYGLFRRHRADYWFRVLHFAPMAMALVWLALQFASERVSALRPVAQWFTWGNTAAAVLVFLALVVIFCLHVIRRRVPRVATLAVLAIAFLVAGVVGERNAWDNTLATVLWNAGPATGSGSGSGQIAARPHDDKNLSPSSNPTEEEWRKKLREVVARSKETQTSSSSAATSRRSSSASSKTVVAVIPPKRLPQSGFGFEAFAGFLVAGYSVVLHRQARRRIRS